MKDLNLLIWLTQLGLSVALPPVVLIWFANYLCRQKGWGSWVIWVGVVLGLVLAFDGLRASLRVLQTLTKSKQDPTPPPVSFNDHD